MTAPETSALLESESTGREGWKASLELGYAMDAEQKRTVPTLRRHAGPLRVQKVYHPEAPHAPGALHQYIVHPPGGVVAGDTLSIHVALDSASQVLLTTPGATKWYKAASAAGAAKQTIALQAKDAILEWLPLENIVFPGARLENQIRIQASDSSCVFASEITSFGLPTRALSFDSGEFKQSTRVHIGEELVFAEQVRLQANNAAAVPLLMHQVGMNAFPILGQLFAYAPLQGESLERSLVMKACREALGALALNENRASFALSCLPFPSERSSFIMLRCRCASVPEAYALIRTAWSELRINWLGIPAHYPRIWST